MKDGCKLELQTPDLIKLFDNTHTHKTNRKDKKWGKCDDSWSSSSSFSPM